LKYNQESPQYRIAIISDKDKRSKNSNEGHWESILRKGTLRRDNKTGLYGVSWDAQQKILTSKMNEAGRGMELSELVYYNNKLLTVDDRTGIIYMIENDQAVPLYILMDGEGSTNKGFKGEWMTVKDGLLYVGSIGKEWSTPEGELLNNNPQWVKTIDIDGHISHIDWSNVYNNIRKAVGADHPGYLMHESVRLHPILK